MSTKIDISETTFQSQVVELAHVCGWNTMHVRRTIGAHGRWVTGTSLAGWPDLALWRPGQFLLVELKTDRGKVTPEQAAVIHSLQEAAVDARVWRPADWDDIQATLTRRSAR